MSDFELQKDPSSPAEKIPPDPKEDKPEEGIALCLSGGGYRAMLFHLGVVWRLYELGILKELKRISSVSGGSITAGVLGMNWAMLSFKPASFRKDFVPLVVEPIRLMASRTIDAGSVVGGALLPGSISEKIENAYRKYLFKGATLQDLPDEPRFVINATNVQSGALWRFMKPYMRDYRVGEVKKPKVELAFAVAASSAFPPFLSPAYMELKHSSYTRNSGLDLQFPPYTTDVVLTDGGVYDNLGLETAWKRYKTILVSDAGGKMEPEPEPKSDWARHAVRVLNLIDNQVRSLRKRQVIGSYKDETRKGAFWDMRMNINDFKAKGKLRCPPKRTGALANVKTRLKRIDDETQERLINWGYALSDAAVRTYHDENNLLKPPRTFPYPNAGV